MDPTHFPERNGYAAYIVIVFTLHVYICIYVYMHTCVLCKCYDMCVNLDQKQYTFKQDSI